MSDSIFDGILNMDEFLPDLDVNMDFPEEWEMPNTSSNTLDISSQNTSDNSLEGNVNLLGNVTLGNAESSQEAFSLRMFFNDRHSYVNTSETAYPSTSSSPPVFSEAPDRSVNLASDSPSSSSNKGPQTVMDSTAKAPSNQEQKQVLPEDKLLEKRRREAMRVKSYRVKKKGECEDYKLSLDAARDKKILLLDEIYDYITDSRSYQYKARDYWNYIRDNSNQDIITLRTTETYSCSYEVEKLTKEIEYSKGMLEYYTEASKNKPQISSLKELLTENEKLKKVLELVSFKKDELKRQIELLENYISDHSPPSSPVDANGSISPRNGYEMTLVCF